MGDHAQVHYAADLVVIDPGCLSGVPYVLLIERAYDPHAGRLALPGGHVDRGETSRAAAVRELHEETGLQVNPADLGLIGIYDEPDRDERYRMISAAYVAIVTVATPAVRAGDDAATAGWYPLDDVLAGIHGSLAFDHLTILLDYELSTGSLPAASELVRRVEQATNAFLSVEEGLRNPPVHPPSVETTTALVQRLGDFYLHGFVPVLLALADLPSSYLSTEDLQRCASEPDVDEDTLHTLQIAGNAVADLREAIGNRGHVFRSLRSAERHLSKLATVQARAGD